MPTNGSPVDHALTFLMADQPEPALRWIAAALERAPSAPIALLLTARSLARLGRTRAAVDGLRLAAERFADARDLALALVAIDDLRGLNVDVSRDLDLVAHRFCRTAPPPGRAIAAQADVEGVEPLSAYLEGAALASKATQLIYDTAGTDWPAPPPPPLFGALDEGTLRELIELFGAIAAPIGHRVIEEREVGDAVYVVAHGELEITRRERPAWPARIGKGAFFGETALLARLPSAFGVTVTRPAILLVADRDGLDTLATRHGGLRRELDLHCRRSAVAHLGKTSPVIAAVPATERASLVEELETRVFEKGARLAIDGDEAPGLHLVISGEVAMVAREGAERTVLATLGAGDTVGEVELVLHRRAAADAIAARRTATLFLPRDRFVTLLRAHPAVLHALYALAVQRDADTRDALASESAAIGDDMVIEERNVAHVVATPPASVPAAAVEPAPRLSFEPASPAPPPVTRTLPPPLFVTPASPAPAPVSTRTSRPVSTPPSLAPLTTAVAAVRPAPSGSFARRSMQGAAVVAVAASVAAVVFTRERRPAIVDARAASPAQLPGSAPVAEGTIAMPASLPRPATAPAPVASAIAPPPAIAPLPAASSRPRVAPARPRPPVPERVGAWISSPDAPAAPSPRPSSSAPPSTTPSAATDEFGGRE